MFSKNRGKIHQFCQIIKFFDKKLVLLGIRKIELEIILATRLENSQYHEIGLKFMNYLCKKYYYNFATIAKYGYTYLWVYLQTQKKIEPTEPDGI